MTYDVSGKRYKRIKSFSTLKAANVFMSAEEKAGKDVAMWSEQNGKFAVGRRLPDRKQ
jgi:hypothetical protein